MKKRVQDDANSGFVSRSGHNTSVGLIKCDVLLMQISPQSLPSHVQVHNLTTNWL